MGDINITLENVVNFKNPNSIAFKSLWPYFYFYRILGYFPLSRNNKNKYSPVEHKFCHISWFFSVFSVLIFVFVFRTIFLQIFVKSTFPTLMLFIQSMTFSLYPLCLFLCCLIISKRLPSFFKNCQGFEIDILKKHSGIGKEQSGQEIIKNCRIFLLILSTLILIDLSIYYPQLWIQFGQPNVSDFFRNLAGFFDLNKFIINGLFLCTLEIYNTTVWFLPDIFISISSIIFTFYIEQLNRSLSERIAVGESENNCNILTEDLEKIRKDYRELIKLIQEFNNSFSALFAISYIGNSAYLFLKLYNGIASDFAPEIHPLIKISVALRLFMIIAKIFVPTWFSAKINDRSKDTLNLIQDLSTGIDGKIDQPRLLFIDHFIRQLTLEEIGISCNGFFTITKSFLVALISGFITYEIVVLEFTS